jgi:hypothetical protein
VLTSTPTLTITANLDVGAGQNACCAAPHALCQGDGSCTTAFTGSDGRFREFVIENATASSTIVEKGAQNQISAVIDAYLGGIVVGTADTVAATNEIYVKPTGATNYTLVANPPCDSPFLNLHWASVTDPLDDWLLTGCRTGSTVTVRQFQLPGGTTSWTVVAPTTVPPPDAFRYLNLDHCGEVTLPDQTTGDVVAYTIPRNNDMVITLTGPVGGPDAPDFSTTTVISGTANDYYGLDCREEQVVIARLHPDGAGMQFVYLDFDDLSGSVNLMSRTEPDPSPAFVNFAPDYAFTVTNDATPVAAYVDFPYLPLVMKGGGLGGTTDYAAVPRVVFFDGFESGDTRFWDNVVGLADEAGESAPPAVAGIRTTSEP